MSAPQGRLDPPVRGLERALRLAAIVAFGLAIIGALIPNRVGQASGGAVVVFIVAVPLVRVLSLGIHWLRLGDRRFAGAALGLLFIVATGSIIAAL